MNQPKFTPTPAQVALAMLDIQANWTPEERHAAAMGLREAGTTLFTDDDWENQPRITKYVRNVRGWQGRAKRLPIF